MPNSTLTGLNNRSTYDQCVAAIDAAVVEVLADSAYEGMELSEGDVWCDLATAYLSDASRPVAEEVCRVQVGFVPGQLLEHWARQDAAKKALDRRRQQEKAAARKAAKEQAERDAEEATRQAIKDNTCPKCFTVRAPSGACNC